MHPILRMAFAATAFGIAVTPAAPRKAAPVTKSGAMLEADWTSVSGP